jgi:DNA-binding transcriptional LysR family regulator
MQFAMRDIAAEFLGRHPKVAVLAHTSDETIDIVGETVDMAVRAHTQPPRSRR